MVTRTRAISEKDKLKRKEKILKTAWKLYKETEGKLPSVSLIAQKTGLSKGTVYLYFKTKDEIFLQLFMYQLREWHVSVASKLQSRKGKISVAEFAKILTDYVVKNPLLLKMGSIVRGVLEENTDERVIIDNRMQIARLLESCGQISCQIFPGLTVDQAAKIHLRIYALIFGLWQITSNPPHIRQALKKADIKTFEPDFPESAVESVATFLKGALPKKE
jgi:TetR/AcrR family transcriptional regulator